MCFFHKLHFSHHLARGVCLCLFWILHNSTSVSLNNMWLLMHSYWMLSRRVVAAVTHNHTKRNLTPAVFGRKTFKTSPNLRQPEGIYGEFIHVLHQQHLWGAATSPTSCLWLGSRLHSAVAFFLLPARTGTVWSHRPQLSPSASPSSPLLVSAPATEVETHLNNKVLGSGTSVVEREQLWY